jgi:hypothetical protein
VGIDDFDGELGVAELGMEPMGAGASLADEEDDDLDLDFDSLEDEEEEEEEDMGGLDVDLE